MNRTIIEKKEMTSLLIIVIIVKLLFTYPRTLVETSGNAAWIQLIYVSLIGLVFYFINVRVYSRCGNNNVITLADKLCGKWLKIPIGFVLSAILIFNAATTIRNIPESINSVLLPHTPGLIIMLVFALAVGIAAYNGIVAMARISSLLLPIGLVVMFGFFLFLFSQIDIRNVFPLLGKGTQNIFLKGIEGISMYSDLIVLNILLPFCKNKRDAKTCGYYSLIISGIVALSIVLMYCLIYPYPISTDFLIPLFQLARLVRIGRFFQRLEAFYEFMWVIMVLLYSAIYLWVISYIWKETFNITYIKPLIFPIISIISLISLMPISQIDFLNVAKLSERIMYYVAFLLPIILASCYRIKARRDTKNENA